MDRSDIIGKTIGDFTDESTKIVDPGFVDDYDVTKEKFEERHFIQIFKSNGKCVIVNHETGLTLVLGENGKAEVIFYCYEIEYASCNEKRNLVSVVGHETDHRYWLDDGEYEMQHTR